MVFRKELYPPDWLAIRQRILQRAGNHCEECGVKNHSWGFRGVAGEFVRLGATELEAHCRNATDVEHLAVEHGVDWYDVKLIRIVLTIAHLNHEPSDGREEVLRAWCQRCHLAYDRPRHIRKAAATRRRRYIERTGQQALFKEVSA
jgi:hypothetical protein